MPVPPDTSTFRARPDDGIEQFRQFGGQRAEPDQIVDLERIGGELADRQRRPVDRERAG